MKFYCLVAGRRITSLSFPLRPRLFNRPPAMASARQVQLDDLFWRSQICNKVEPRSKTSAIQPAEGFRLSQEAVLKKLEDFDEANFGFCLSFRFMNLTDCSFFDPKVSIFLLVSVTYSSHPCIFKALQCHAQHDLTITQILQYHTDIPLEFLEMPITVTVSRNPSDIHPFISLDIRLIVETPTVP